MKSCAENAERRATSRFHQVESETKRPTVVVDRHLEHGAIRHVCLALVLLLLLLRQLRVLFGGGTPIFPFSDGAHFPHFFGALFGRSSVLRPGEWVPGDDFISVLERSFLLGQSPSKTAAPIRPPTRWIRPTRALSLSLSLRLIRSTS